MSRYGKYSWVLISFFSVFLHACGGVLEIDGSDPDGSGAGGATTDADAAGEPGVRYIGRFDFADSAAPVASWPGSAMVARFEGAAVSVKLEDMPRGVDDTGAANQSFLNASIDGGPPTVLALRRGQAVYPVATNLGPGPHELVLYKRTEASVGDVRFHGLEFPAGGKLLPPPAPSQRRIELIGDSAALGYGIEGTDESCPFTPRTENNYLSYGALTARALQAEATFLMFSGKGVYRNNNGDLHGTLPQLYGRTLPWDRNSRWDFSSWVPQAVVINLGSNDFSPGTDPGAQFVTAYRNFVQLIRRNYPEAHIFCTLGPMINDAHPPGIRALSTARTYVTRVVDELRAAGDERVHWVEFPQQRGSENGFGCNYHPNVATHRKVAEQLIPILRAELGW